MVSGDYLGMSLSIADMDTENLTYFGYCSEVERVFHDGDVFTELPYHEIHVPF